MTTRRNLLKLALVSAPFLTELHASSKDQFWNTKEPSDWSDKETNELLTHSPWAKKTTVDMRGEQSSNTGMGRQGRGTMGEGGLGGGGGGPMGGGSGGMGGGGGMSPQARGGSMEGPGSRAEMPQVQALVVWESPSPIGLALKKTPSPELSKSYVITVAGFPLHERNSEASRGNEGLEQVFKEGTSLQRKGQDPIVPDKVEIADNAGVSFIRFTFPRDPKPISLEDKDVEFVTSLGRTSLKTKFSLKDMTYKGQLAL